ncbi:hypothetical protein PS2_013630 [Malus domestica]
MDTKILLCSGVSCRHFGYVLPSLLVCPWRLSPSLSRPISLRQPNNHLQLEHSSSVSSHQSFDHLTDIWLPSAELGYNNRTKRKLVLTS